MAINRHADDDHHHPDRVGGPSELAILFDRRAALGRIATFVGAGALALTGIRNVAANRRRTTRPWESVDGDDGADAASPSVDNSGTDDSGSAGVGDPDRGEDGDDVSRDVFGRPTTGNPATGGDGPGDPGVGDPDGPGDDDTGDDGAGEPDETSVVGHPNTGSSQTSSTVTGVRSRNVRRG